MNLPISARHDLVSGAVWEPKLEANQAKACECRLRQFAGGFELWLSVAEKFRGPCPHMRATAATFHILLITFDVTSS